MTGLQRIQTLFSGRPVDRLPALSILHSGLARLARVPLGDYFSSAETMARVTVDSARRFGLDGVQLSQGVTAEAEALGAEIHQPPDGAPELRQILLDSAISDEAIACLAAIDPCQTGRLPLYREALEQASREIGSDTFILATLRGPLLLAAQLRGAETLLMDLLTDPEASDRLLEFTTGVAIRLGEWLTDSGAHGLIFGEATCSPDFISPVLYRDRIVPLHQRLVSALKHAGWPVVGLHICGRIEPIIPDILATGVDFFDIDYAVPASRALELTGDGAVLRGNLDPASLFRFGTPEQVHKATRALIDEAKGRRWILSSGCDIPAGAPAENIEAFMSEIISN
ncbi:uroporphyrinogen decarboxylase family protein [bacterium]|nr:uroporphyrinogen decarboxylase family protein [bacterium]